MRPNSSSSRKLWSWRCGFLKPRGPVGPVVKPRGYSVIFKDVNMAIWCDLFGDFTCESGLVRVSGLKLVIYQTLPTMLNFIYNSWYTLYIILHDFGWRAWQMVGQVRTDKVYDWFRYVGYVRWAKHLEHQSGFRFLVIVHSEYTFIYINIVYNIYICIHYISVCYH